MASKFADYSFGRVQDPYEGLRKSLSGVEKRFDTRMARERQEELDRQALINQMKANRRAQEKLDIEKAQEQRAADKVAQDIALGEILQGAQTKALEGITIKGKDTIIPAVKGNEALVAKQKEALADALARQKAQEREREMDEVAYDYYLDEQLDNMWKENRVPVPRANVYGVVPKTDLWFGSTEPQYITETGERLSIDPSSPLGKKTYGDKYIESSKAGPVPTVPGIPTRKYTEEEAKEAARVSAGLDLPAPDPVEIPKVDKLIKAKAEEVIKGKDKIKKISELTTDELAAAKRDWSGDLLAKIYADKTLKGTTKLAAVEKIEKQADALFGKDPKAATFDQRLKVIEHEQLGLAAKKLADDLNITLPEGISGKAAMKYVEATPEYKKSKEGKGSVVFSSDNIDKFVSRINIPLATRLWGRDDARLLNKFLTIDKVQDYMTRNKITSDAFNKMVKDGLKQNPDLEDVLEAIGEVWVPDARGWFIHEGPEL